MAGKTSGTPGSFTTGVMVTAMLLAPILCVAVPVGAVAGCVIAAAMSAGGITAAVASGALWGAGIAAGLTVGAVPLLSMVGGGVSAVRKVTGGIKNLFLDAKGLFTGKKRQKPEPKSEPASGPAPSGLISLGVSGIPAQDFGPVRTGATPGAKKEFDLVSFMNSRQNPQQPQTPKKNASPPQPNGPGTP